MVYHVLNGDALVSRFTATGLAGEIVVMREALIEGDLSGESLAAFWQHRARYLAGAYHDEEERYFKEVVPEMQKLLSAPPGAAIHFWFGYDLFCQVKFWFLLSLLSGQDKVLQLSVVYPSYLTRLQLWDDFGSATPLDLHTAFDKRTRITPPDLQLGKQLWRAYRSGNRALLENLAAGSSPCFPHLQEVVSAHLERLPETGQGRPRKVLEKIMQKGGVSFYQAFQEFSRTEGVYGFGDLQVRQWYDEILLEKMT